MTVSELAHVVVIAFILLALFASAVFALAMAFYTDRQNRKDL